MNTNELTAQLKRFVLIKSGLRNIDPSHCKNISELVFKETKNYVSETTVKRFFGFAQAIHKFSLFTLNSFSQYIGYPDWESFCKDKREQTDEVTDTWSDLKIRTRAITDVSLIALKNSSGVPFAATANRSFLYSDFDYFLRNKFQFTTISAQPGKGKSILIAHIVEHFFCADNAPYKNDVILLINSAIIYDILQNDLSLKDWFYKEFKFHGVSELITHFKKNSGECKGRLVFMIDGIDQLLSKISYQKILTDFLFSIEENDFFKVVLGLRVNNWVGMQPAIADSAFLTNSWYKGLFFDYENNTNIPPLNKDEVFYTLTRIEGKVIGDGDLHDNLVKLFQTPFWLQVYYKLKQENNKIRLKNNLLCLELITYFLENKIFLSKNSTEKIFILKKITNEISRGSVLHRVSKEQVLDYIKNYPEAYRELTHSGILIEEKRFTTSIPTEIVRFLNNDIYTYFLFLQLKQKFNFKPDKAFFEEILTGYADKEDLRILMLSWAIRFCINRNEIPALKQIFKLSFSNEEKNKASDFIYDVALQELEKTDAQFNAQTIDMHFIDIMVMGSMIEKKDIIKKISEKVFNEDIQVMLNVIECGICILDIDRTGLNANMSILKRHYEKLCDLFPLNPYDLILYFSNALNNKKSDLKKINENILKVCRQIYKSAPQKNENLGSAEIICYQLIITVLFSNKKYTECDRFLQAIVKKYPEIFYLRSSTFSSFLLIIAVQNNIKLNQYKKAQRLIRYMEKLIGNDNTYYTPYIKASHLLARVNFFNHTKNYENVFEEIEKGLLITGKYKLYIMEIALKLIKIDALKHANNAESINNAIKDLLNFLHVNNLIIPDFANINNPDFDHVFKILKSYK